MESARKTRRFRRWALVVSGALIGMLLVAVFSYQAFTDFQRKLAERNAVCPLVPEAQQDCVKFLVALRGRITSQGRPCDMIRKVGMKSDAITKKIGFDVSCASAATRTIQRYEVEDGGDHPLIRVIP